jgi:hypothetical protein
MMAFRKSTLEEPASRRVGPNSVKRLARKTVLSCNSEYEDVQEFRACSGVSTPVLFRAVPLEVQVDVHDQRNAGLPQR